jgi:hypothetical protein
VSQLIDQGKGVLATSHRIDEYEEFVDSGKIKGFRSAALSFIERVYGKDHTHYKEFSAAVDGYRPEDAQMGTSILESIKDELDGGWLFSIKGLVTAEVFADFVDMSNYLLEQDYKDPAAIIAGSVLEEHLRQLCAANGIDIEFQSQGVAKPKKADTLNSDLGNFNIYNKLDQKAVTMWLDLRNKAAHGHYDQYTKEQVSNMI